MAIGQGCRPRSRPKLTCHACHNGPGCMISSKTSCENVFTSICRARATLRWWIYRPDQHRPVLLLLLKYFNQPAAQRWEKPVLATPSLLRQPCIAESPPPTQVAHPSTCHMGPSGSHRASAVAQVVPWAISSATSKRRQIAQRRSWSIRAAVCSGAIQLH